MVLSLVVEGSVSLNDLVATMHIADGLECEINDIIVFYKHENTSWLNGMRRRLIIGCHVRALLKRTSRYLWCVSSIVFGKRHLIT